MDVSRTDIHRRHRVGSAHRDQRAFSHTADRTHAMNVADRPKRGGIRL